MGLEADGGEGQAELFKETNKVYQVGAAAGEPPRVRPPASAPRPIVAGSGLDARAWAGY